MMDSGSRHVLREYLWFALLLLAMLIGSANQWQVDGGIRNQSAAGLAVTTSSR